MDTIDSFDIWLWTVFGITGLIYLLLRKKKLIAKDASSIEKRLLIGLIMALVIWIYSLLFD